jgi:tetratricopeptide (TPR) repeat protein
MLSSHQAAAFFEQSKSLFQQGELEAALKSLDAALTLAADPTYLITKAELLSRMERYAEAIENYDIFLFSAPDDIIILKKKLNLLLELKKYPAALEILTHLFELDPDSEYLTQKQVIYKKIEADDPSPLGAAEKPTFLPEELVAFTSDEGSMPIIDHVLKKPINTGNPALVADFKKIPTPVFPWEVSKAQVLEEYTKNYYTLDVPHNNDCLFWAAFFGLLLPCQDPELFDKVYTQILGDDPGYFLPTGKEIEVNTPHLKKAVHKMLQSYAGTLESMQIITRGLLSENTNFEDLIGIFRQRVADEMSRIFPADMKQAIAVESGRNTWEKYIQNICKKGSWGSEAEIKGISSLTSTNITVFAGKDRAKVHDFTAPAYKENFYLIHTGMNDEEKMPATHYNFGITKEIYAILLSRQLKLSSSPHTLKPMNKIQLPDLNTEPDDLTSTPFEEKSFLKNS